jgi:hypothetical protein
MSWTDSSQNKMSKWQINTWSSAQHPRAQRKHKSKPHWDSTSLLLERLPSRSQTTSNAIKDSGEKGTFIHYCCECNLVQSSMESSMEVPQKTKNK